MKIKLTKFLLIFSIGGALYCLLEILWRGYSHWTIGVCGGLCLMILVKINSLFTKIGLLVKCAVGCCAITAVEFAAGCIVNLLLGWDVWSYVGMKGNVLGQICLRFMGIWYLICIPVFAILVRFGKIKHNRAING